MPSFTHFNSEGDAHMIDVGEKDSSHRIAVAEGRILIQPETLLGIRSGAAHKGDVLGVARVAGILAAKRTAEFIPLCHSLALTHVAIDLIPEDHPAAIYCRAQVETRGRTGVEIEALHAVQITLLTIYDMCKAIDRGMTIQEVRLIEKQGGRSGHWKR